jgi:hypothetical protein
MFEQKTKCGKDFRRIVRRIVALEKFETTA